MKRIITTVVLCAMLASPAYAGGLQRGFAGKLKQIGARIVVGGMLAAAACGISGCGEEADIKDVVMVNEHGQESAEVVVSVASVRAAMLSDQSHFYSGRHVYFWDDSGITKRGRVIGYLRGGWVGENEKGGILGWLGDNQWVGTFLIQTPDGSEEVVDKKQIGGWMLHSSPDIGIGVELRLGKVNERLTGRVIAVYGFLEYWEEWEGNRFNGDWVVREELIATYYVVELDSGLEVFVPQGSILDWLD